MAISFENQVVVVTGGGGGIGREACLDLARRGASVVVNDVSGLDHPDGPGATLVVKEIEAAGGTAIESFDSIATPEGGQAVVDRAVDTYGTVDAVVHFAGTWRHSMFSEMTADQLDPVLDVHLRGAFFVARPAWNIMKEKGYGRIVLTSSSTGMWGRIWGTNYAAAKAGLMGLARGMSLEGAEHNIFTNCLMPVASAFNPYREEHPEHMRAQFKTSGWVSGGNMPPQSTAERAVGVPVYLASRDCSVNGESFSACGGRYARIFVGVTDGWLSDHDRVPTADDFAEHLAEIEDQSSYIVPNNVNEEMIRVGRMLEKRDGEQYLV
jgi:NAD(P)-dependent dehydrogenase (short-subunit alcohol dehydrogenase family)